MKLHIPDVIQEYPERPKLFMIGVNLKPLIEMNSKLKKSTKLPISPYGLLESGGHWQKTFGKNIE